jgi:hypothetical protein
MPFLTILLFIGFLWKLVFEQKKIHHQLLMADNGFLKLQLNKNQAIINPEPRREG